MFIRAATWPKIGELIIRASSPLSARLRLASKREWASTSDQSGPLVNFVISHLNSSMLFIKPCMKIEVFLFAVTWFKQSDPPVRDTFSPHKQDPTCWRVLCLKDSSVITSVNTVLISFLVYGWNNQAKWIFLQLRVSLCNEFNFGMFYFV